MISCQYLAPQIFRIAGPNFSTFVGPMPSMSRSWRGLVGRAERDGGERAVVEHAIGRDAQALGFAGAPLLQPRRERFAFCGQGCGRQLSTTGSLVVLRFVAFLPNLDRVLKLARALVSFSGGEFFGDAVADQQVDLRRGLRVCRPVFGAGGLCGSGGLRRPFHTRRLQWR